MEEDMGIFRRLISSGEGGASFPFIIRITTTTSNTSFTLPIADYLGLTPNFSVNWGDGGSGVVTSSTDLDKTHVYVSAGTYDISITGFMPSFKVNNNAGIRGLIVALIQWGTVGLRAIDFYGCINLTSIPGSGTLTGVGGYTGLSEVVSFGNFMRATGVTSIPSDIFNYSPNATTFTDSFSSTQITAIPSGLFDINVSATNFGSCFNNCTVLSSVPSTLFDLNVNAISFSSTFRNCISITSPLQFTYNNSVTTFANVYNMATTTNAMAGTAPELWNRIPAPVGTDAFRNCINLTNYASIPTIWK